MKKKLLIALTLSLAVALPVKVSAKTLQDYINEVNKYKSEVNSANAAINKASQEITSAQNEISYIKKETVNLTNEITKLNNEIEESNEKIKQKSLEIKTLFQYYQMTDGENTYLEYIFGATSITDLIYRLSVVEQITDYNKKVQNELEQLIEKNKGTQKQLAAKTKELNAKQITLSNRIKQLEGTKQSLKSGAASSQAQVEIYDKIVTSYKNQGCKPSDIIGVDCAKENRVAGWYRPTQKGGVSQWVGPSSYSLDGFHYGTDVYSARQRGEKIYAVAAGTITSIYKDIYGAKIVVISHTDLNGKSWTSLYCHLSSYNPSIYVGMKVTPDTYVGYMGDTGYAFGVHLHLEIVDCKIYVDSKCSTWKKYQSYIRQRYNGGFAGARTLIGLPTSWSSR